MNDYNLYYKMQEMRIESCKYPEKYVIIHAKVKIIEYYKNKSCKNLLTILLLNNIIKR